MHPTHPLMGGQANIDPLPSSRSFFFFFPPTSPFPPDQGGWESIENQGNRWKISWSWNVLDWTFTSKGTSETGGRDRDTSWKNFEGWAAWMRGSKLRSGVMGRMLTAQTVDERSKTQQMNGTNKCCAVNTSWHLNRGAKPPSTQLLLTTVRTKAHKRGLCWKMTWNRAVDLHSVFFLEAWLESVQSSSPTNSSVKPALSPRGFPQM